MSKGRSILASLLAAVLVFGPSAVALAQNEGDAAGAAAGAAGLGFGLIWTVCMLLFFALWVAGVVFWIMMIVDCVKREEEQFPGSTGSSKTLWLVLVIVLGIIGAIVYYFMIKKKAPLPKA